MNKVVKFILHYLLSTFTYGIFGFPLLIIAGISGITFLSTLTTQDPTNIVNVIVYAEKHNIVQILTPLFLIITLLFNIYIKTRLLIWLTQHVRIILLGITGLFVVTFIIASFNINDPEHTLKEMWFIVYLVTIISTLFGLGVTKMSLIFHQVIDSVKIAHLQDKDM